MLRSSLALATCALGLIACGGGDTTHASGDTVARSADGMFNSDGVLNERPGNDQGPGQDGIKFPRDPKGKGIQIQAELQDSDCGKWIDSPFTPRTIDGSLTSLDRIQPWTASITGDVVLNADVDIDNVQALRCVESIGGTLRIEGQPNVAHIVMPKLREVGALEIQSMDNLEALRMHKLQDVGQISIVDAPALDIVRLPEVTSLPGGLVLEGLSMASLESYLPGLEEAGSVSLVDLPQFNAFMHDSIALDGGAVELSGLDSLEQMGDFPFQEVGEIIISENDALQSTAGASVEDGALVDIFANPVLADLNVLAAASTLGATNIADNAALEDLDGFAGVTAVDGNLVIANHAALIDTTGLDALVSVQGDLRITGAAALSAEEIEALELALADVDVTGTLEVSGGAE